MNIKVKINKLQMNNLKGYATLTLDDCLVIKGIKIMESKNGNLFVSFPSQKVGDEYKDTVFPIAKEFRKELINAILEEYGPNTLQEDFETDLPF